MSQILGPERREMVVLSSLTIWGLLSFFQGAGLSFFVSGSHQTRDIAFIELVYSSVIAGVLISLISARLASVLCLLSAVVAIFVVFETNGFGHGAAASQSMLLPIALRPVVTGLLLLLLPALGPFARAVLK